MKKPPADIHQQGAFDQKKVSVVRQIIIDKSLHRKGIHH